jgi:predicted PurR-regulated permease PerM
MDRNLRRRIAVGTGVAALALVVGYALLSFVAVAVFAVFLYYAVRPIFRFLTRFRLGRRVRAVLSLVLFGVPFLVLLGYAVAIVAAEVQSVLDTDAANRVADELNIAGLDLEQLEGIVTDGGGDISFDLVVDALFGAASVAGSVLVQLLLVVLVTYYALVDGARVGDWLLDTYDESGVVRRYFRAVDDELSIALFGNIVNVFATAIIAIALFVLYNALVPSTVTIPYPALLGAFAGIGSLIPIIGIKLVYVPLTVGLGANAWLEGEPGLLGAVGVLFVASAVVVDFVPDFVIRALISSEDTHTGLLIIAYILGPSVFGFYGLFLAPVLLVCATNAVTILLPYAVFGESKAGPQTSLDQFAGDDPQPAESGDD